MWLVSAISSMAWATVRRGGQRGHLGARHHDVAHRLVAEGERPAHEGLLDLVDVAHLLAGLQDHAQLFFGVGQVALGGRLDAEEPEDAGGRDVHEPGDGPGDQVEPAERQGDEQGGPLGLADGDRLGHQLAEDDGEEGDEHEGDDGGRDRVHRHAEHVGEGLGSQPAQAHAGDRDPELGGREIGVEMVDDVVGHGRPPAAHGGQFGHAGVAHLDDGELGHHEEGVHEDQEYDADDLDRGVFIVG